MNLEFYKYHGAGNDFIIINNIDNKLSNFVNSKFIKKICTRHFGIGADGLIVLENDEQTDFSMRYFNADGNESTMCGNGGRCIVAFANDLGLIKNKQVTFNAVDGKHSAYIEKQDYISLEMIDVQTIENYNDYFLANTGSPHYVEFIKNLKDFDVYKKGKQLRYSTPYKPDGTNINFAEYLKDEIFIRTYERGVENETMACGTGSVAVALASKFDANNGTYKVTIKTRGGILTVSFTKINNTYKKITLSGPVKFVFKGTYPLL